MLFDKRFRLNTATRRRRLFRLENRDVLSSLLEIDQGRRQLRFAFGEHFRVDGARHHFKLFQFQS